MKRVILITGASAGIGAACASLLAERGYLVYAGYRSLPADSPSQNLIPVLLDVCQPEHWQAVIAQIAENEPQGLYALINNAGIGLGGPIEYLPIEHFRRQFEVNYFAVLQGIQACLPLLRLGEAGRIVNISSVNGKIATPFLSPYCSSKFALEALTESLRLELWPWGIYCTLIEPGVIATSIFDKSQAHIQQLRQDLPAHAIAHYGSVFTTFEKALSRISKNASQPEDVATVVEQALKSRVPRLRYAVGRDAKVLLFLRKFMPDIVMERIFLKFSAGTKSEVSS